RGPVYLYLYVIFGLLAPWSALLPAALWHGLSTGQTDESRQPCRRFALVYFWTVFAFFTLAASRRSYYLMPVLPAAALLIGQLLARPGEFLGGATRGLLAGGGCILAIIVVGAGSALLMPQGLRPPAWKELPALPYPWIFALGWVVCVAALGLAVWCWQPKRWA